MAGVWLVRHGESAANAGGASSDPAAIPLTALGRRQARRLVSFLDRAPEVIVTSPFARARQTAAPLRDRYPYADHHVWPIHEFTYLSPARCTNTTQRQRLPLVRAYWERADPDVVDGADAESFAQFASRVRDFHRRLPALKGFVVVFGHETFFRTYLLGLGNGFRYTPEDMRRIAAGVTPPRIGNAEILSL